jgi:preprotein translocase subunit SecG
MLTVVIVIHLMIVLAMIGVVLLQKSEGGGLGMGGGGAGGFLTSRGTANVLTRTTAILAMCFFATSLILSILAGLDRKPRSIVTPASSPTAPASPGSAPLAPAGGLLDTLRGGEPAPAAPAAGTEVTAKGRVSGPSVFAGQVGRLAGQAHEMSAEPSAKAVWNSCEFKDFETPSPFRRDGGFVRGRHEGSG